MTRRKALEVVAPAPGPDDKPITQGMILSWGKIVGFILPIMVTIIVSVWQFSGNTKAAEVTINTEVAALKQSAESWRDSMEKATKALEKLTETTIRFDERLRASERESADIKRRIEKLEDK